jgi:predicted RNA binding protein YcfA (HicA-like mRNA interferase family)
LGRLPQVSGERVCRALDRAGLEYLRTKGGHRYYRRAAGPVFAVPVHGSKPVKPGTLAQILEDAGLSVEEFKALL